MRKTFFCLFTVMLLLGFTALSYPEMVVSLKQDTDVTLPRITVDVHLADGKRVTGYSLLLAYDPAVLRYVDTIQGDYLPTGGIFIRPALGDNDTYELQLSIGETTTTGQFVNFGEGEGAQTLSLSNFFFKIPDPAEIGMLQEVDTDIVASDLKYQAVSVLSSAPLASDGTLASSDGNGTLASLSFDVLNPDTPMVINLVGITLFGANDTELPATLVNNVATFKKLASDVNADGTVNILDLTRVASVFGEPVTADNRVADVNVDDKINILDLVMVAQDIGIGKSVLSVVYTTELPVDQTQSSELSD